MLLNRLTMRTSLVATVVAMAVLGLGLAVVTGRIYRDHAIDNERTAVTEQLQVAVQNLQRRLDQDASALARALREQPIIANGAIVPQLDLVQKGLERLAIYYSVANPGVSLIDLAIHDTRLQLIARQGAAADLERSGWLAACDHVRTALEQRNSRSPVQSSSGYCLTDGHLYYSAYVPIGDPLAGYLVVVTDALAALGALENVLGLPVRVALPDGLVLQESSGWPEASGLADSLVAAHVLELPNKAALVIQVAKDEGVFYAKLEQTRYAVFFAAAAVTLLVVLIAIAFLDKTAVGPLRSLAEQLRRMRGDESQLGQRIAVRGNVEADEIASSFNQITERVEELYQNLEHMAFTDPLTRLPNRNLLLDRLEKTVANARSENKAFALFVMDLNRFKEINSTLGHHVGDLVLQQVAIRLRAKLRESDIIARMGGDEFAVIMPTETPKQADMAARMLLQSLRSPFTIEAHHLDIETSIGVALYPDHGVDAQTLIQRADVAMYAAKQSNAGHMFYDSQMDRHHPAQLTLLGELRHAIEQEQFVLYFQPKIGLKTDRVVGVEALVRWRHPSGKLIMPETFIPLLEQTGLIRSLTGWVTHEALRIARELRTRGFDLPIAVNISARDLHNNGLAEELAEQLAVHQGLAQWLELEITESTVMADIGGALEVLTRLAAMGFRLVIDDFGTGYSSLAYLKRLPVHAVKIDKSFVMGMVKDDNDAAIVYTSIELSHNLGLQVVAEGVDDEAVLVRLRARGCDSAQGIYLSRPLPAEELFEWLAKSNWGFPAVMAS